VRGCHILPRNVTRPVLTERYWNWRSKAGTLCQNLRSRFAATVFLWIKPINSVRILPQMFMFLADTTKTDFYIYWFVHTYWFLHVSILVCSWSSLTKYIENTAARSWSWSKCQWEDQDGVIIWWKICWHFFLRGHLWEIFVWKPHTFR